MTSVQSAYNKQYYLKHRDRINNRHKELITCECGTAVRRSSHARHKKSLRHQKALTGGSQVLVAKDELTKIAELLASALNKLQPQAATSS